MRRICLSATACTALALAMPAGASAHHRGRHHHHHAHPSRTITFAAHRTSTTSSSPTTPTPPASEGEAAGTIASFENGILKLTLADGSVVSGKVTEVTRIDCPMTSSNETRGEDDDNEGLSDDQGEQGGGNGDQGEQGGGSGDGGDHHGLMEGRGDDENGGSGDGGMTCGPGSLVAGAKVAEAELVISSAGASWEKVDLQ